MFTSITTSISNFDFHYTMGCECSTAEKIPEIPRRSQNESILANAHWVITAINGLRDGGVDNATNKTYELLSRDAKLQVLKDLEQSIARKAIKC